MSSVHGLLGSHGQGTWQAVEMYVAQRLAEEKGTCRVIPVLLPGADPANANTLPLFLGLFTWVDFRSALNDEASFHRLCSSGGCGSGGVPQRPGGHASVRTSTIGPVHTCPLDDGH